MIERSQHGVKKGSAFNTQWISDLTDIFGSSAVSTSGDTTTVNLTDVQGETLEIQSVYSNDVTTVRLYYGASNIEITSSNTDYWIAYRLVKFDNGVIAFTPFQNSSNASSLDAHESAKRLSWFICTCTNLSDNSQTKAVFKATAGVYSDRPDSESYYRSYIGSSSSELTTNYSDNGGSVVGAPIMILQPSFVRSMPLVTEQIFIKTQSTEQYDEIVLNNKNYLSCATFCVPLEV